jgi:predicted DNA-binding protein (MmcQ/YjbR family)
LRSFLSKQPLFHFGFWVKGRLTAVKPPVAVFFIGPSNHNPADFAPVQGACAHVAGLQRYIKGGIGQVFGAEVIKSGGNSNHFGMGGYIGKPLGLVVAAANDAAVLHYHCPYRNFLFLKGNAGFGKGHLHKMYIGIGKSHRGKDIGVLNEIRVKRYLSLMDLETFRHFCLSLPGVTEGFPFGETVLVFKVGEKIFALADAEIFATVNLKCDPELAIELRERYPAVIPGYHMNKKHWNTVHIDGSVPAKLLLEWTRHSYDLVKASLPARIRQALDG